MLPKKDRLNKKTIESIFKQGNLINSPVLVFRYLKDTNNKKSNFSFIVPKNIARLSTKRNKLKRLGYLALEKCLNFIPEGITGAFIFKKQEEKKEILENEIKKIYNKIN